MKTKIPDNFKARLRCGQCQMVSINGAPCHEIGCPNMRSRWDIGRQEWIRQRVCHECGSKADYDAPCCYEYGF